MKTICGRYNRLAQAYAVTCDLLYEMYQELNVLHATFMESFTRIGPGDLVRYDGKEGIFDGCFFEELPKMTLLKEDGTVGEEKLIISDWIWLRKVKKEGKEGAR